MSLDQRFPAYSDLERRARRRLPEFVWEYLDSGTGDEVTVERNRRAFEAVTLLADILQTEREIDLGIEFLGRRQSLPFGFAPVGMSGLVWSGAEQTLAAAADRAGIPYCLSTVAADTPEAVGEVVGKQGWFQLYPLRDRNFLKDLLNRARISGFHTLVITVDLAAASRRERLTRAGVTNPMKLTPRILTQCAMRPSWSFAMLKRGIPKLETLSKYADAHEKRSGTAHIGYQLRTAPDWRYLKTVRELWGGSLIVKGVMDPAVAEKLFANGADAIWVSNHGGRQFDASPASLEVLSDVRRAIGDKPLIFDSGVRSGTDIVKALALGADMVMLGRAPLIALAALGSEGVDHYIDMLRAGIEADLGQLGFIDLDLLGSRLVSVTNASRVIEPMV